MREIILDTETTGLDPAKGDRLVELGAVELINHLPTGQTFHRYINPERDVPAEAAAVHGLTGEFLKKHPIFSEVVADFLDFIADSTLVIHNASFDVGFLNAELARLKLAPIGFDRVIDTLKLARQKFPMAQNSLDALCKRFGIDNTRRTKHGALLDSELLADVYLELVGGRQVTLSLAPIQRANGIQSGPAPATTTARRETPLPPRLTEEDMARHRAFAKALGPGALWLKIEPETAQ